MPEDLEVIDPVVEETTAPTEEQGESTSESVTDETAATLEAAKPNGTQKRIDRLTREKHDAIRKAEILQALLDQQGKHAEAPKTAPVDTGKPKEDDFATATEYVEALTDWKIEQRSQAERAARQKEEESRNQTELQKKVQRELAEYRKQVPDFDEVMEDAAFNSSPHMTRELQESDMGPALLYHFAKNPEEANRIADIADPRKVAKEVAKIEARIASSAPASKQAPITSTPAPIKPVAASRQVIAKMDQIDDDTEWLKQRNAEIAARRQR